MLAMAKTAYFNEPSRIDLDAPGRRGRKRRATAHRIFKSAIELMQKDGFNGVSIEQICERADVARATFFQHFSSKAALMSVFTDLVRQRIEDELAKELLAPTNQLRLIVEHLQQLTTELGPIAPDLLSAFVTEPGGGFRIDDPETGMVQLIVGIVKQGQAEGTITANWSPEEVAIGLVSAWVGVARHNVRPPECWDGAPLGRILDLFMSGLTPR
jgi:AcrR family transcriptional regulator